MERSHLPTIKGYIHRPRIDALIETSLEYSLALVIAGPGYGKTLSVAHYMKNADVRLVWVRFFVQRTRAEEIWEDFVGSAALELPEYAQGLRELGFPGSAGSFAQFRKLTAEVAAGGSRLVFVLDGYEKLVDREVIRFFDNLIEADLTNFTLFILCNVMLPFADVLPASGQFRITDQNLVFTLAEAEDMFRQYGAQAPQHTVERAIKATGGWPLGLRLICEFNPENPEDYTSRSPVQMVAALYDQHYYRNYPPKVQEQLILLSLLPQFSLDMVQPKADTMREQLSDLFMRHPFISYDYMTGLYRFQPMYHDFLRQRHPLMSREAHDGMNIFAGRWFLDHGMVSEAMDCFWAAADYDGFLETVGNLPLVRTQASVTDRILRRLEQIPREYADKNLAVDFSTAFMYLNAADAHRARTLLLDVEARLKNEPDTEEKRLMLGDIYATLADISTYLNEDTGLGWMKKAFELIPHGSRTHAPELMALGNQSAFFLPGNKAGELGSMVEYFYEYSKYADQVKNGCGHGYEYLFAGEAAYYREDMDNAATLLNSAMLKAQHTGQHDIICNALWNLGRIELYYGNHKNALALLGEIEAYINDNGLVGLYELRDCAIAYFYLLLEDISMVPAWLCEAMHGPDEMPVTIARRHLVTAFCMQMKGEAAKAFAVVLQLESLLEGKGRWYEKFCLYIFKAQRHMAAKQDAEFGMAFKQAYDMVYANDMKLALSSYGREMMALLDHLKRTDAAGYDTEWLDVVYRDAASMAKRLQMMRLAYGGGERSVHSTLTLTKRENETLRYLAQGLTQPEMAKLMGISANAVKKHVSKIYYKLGAVNRADAIHIATVNGLVDVLSN